ncbi:MAG: hypothetical protein JW787_14025 [Sedimentisphaerales bacterium]|nr:hypothetical protein [Sedimentisphaerales bacterium]
MNKVAFEALRNKCIMAIICLFCVFNVSYANVTVSVQIINDDAQHRFFTPVGDFSVFMVAQANPAIAYNWQWEADEGLYGELVYQNSQYSVVNTVGSGTPGVYNVEVEADPSGVLSWDLSCVHVFDLTITNPYGNPTISEGANSTNERVFNSASPGVLTVECVAVPTPDTAVIREYLNNNRVRWTITPISGSVLTWNSSWPGDSTKGEGLSCTATFTGLPSDSNSFGLKEVKLEVLTDGGNVILTRNTYIEVFYTKIAKNHPSDETNDSWPNWYYYWLQTVIPLGSPYPTFIYWEGDYFNYFEMGTTNITLCDNSSTEYNAPYGTNNPLQGIDLFAWRVRHESQHYQDSINLWGNDLTDWLNNHVGKTGPSDDKDGDYLPNQMEDVNLNSIYDAGDLYDFNDMYTGSNHDNEDWNYQRNKGMVGNHALDWGNPGMQHDKNDEYNN